MLNSSVRMEDQDFPGQISRESLAGRLESDLGSFPLEARRPSQSPGIPVFGGEVSFRSRLFVRDVFLTHGHDRFHTSELFADQFGRQSSVVLTSPSSSCPPFPAREGTAISSPVNILYAGLELSVVQTAIFLFGDELKSSDE